jgi:hypothetical protein
MANALTVSDNLTPGQNHHFLNQWYIPMIENIWHFNQCAGIGAPVLTANDKGGAVYIQSEREMIARALESAAMRMAIDLNYWPCPAYFQEEFTLGKGWPSAAQVFRGRWLQTVELGSRAQSVIQAGAAVAYSDPTGSGVNDTATIIVNTTVANDEIRLYYQAADSLAPAGDVRYEIEPISVTDNGAGQVTIVAHRALFVKPSEWKLSYLAIDPNLNNFNIIDTATAAGFVTAVDVYRVYTDTTSNIQLLSADGTLLQTFTGEIQNAYLSAFRMGNLCGSFCFDKYPSRIVVNYKAGSPLVDGFVDAELLEAMIAYAAGNMLPKLSKMSGWTQEVWTRYHAPMVESEGGSIIPVATTLQANSGYGARTGQVKAWDTVMSRRIMRANKFF